MTAINEFINDLNGILFSQYVITTLLITGVVFTVMTVFGQWRAITHGTAVVRGKFDESDDPGAISHFQALATALSATVGLGNIAGVAIAVSLGGPGAVFWMWVIGVLGMALKMTEVTQSMLYRNTEDPKNPHGGPMFVAKYGFERLGLPRIGMFVGGLFVVTLLISAATGGNMFQVWNAADTTFTNFEFPKIYTGYILAGITFVVIIGGITFIGRVASIIVPFMCVVYLLAALWVLGNNITAVPGMLWDIIAAGTGLNSDAGVGGAFVGGTLGFAIMQGMKRALFSSEAGQGSAPIAHAAVKTDEPVREGIVAGLEPLIDTVIVCTITALVLLSTGAFNREAEATFDSEIALNIVPAMDDDGEAIEDTWTMEDVDTLPPKTEFYRNLRTNDPFREVDPATIPDWRAGDQVFVRVEASKDEESGMRLRKLFGTVTERAGADTTSTADPEVEAPSSSASDGEADDVIDGSEGQDADDAAGDVIEGVQETTGEAAEQVVDAVDAATDEVAETAGEVSDEIAEAVTPEAGGEEAAVILADTSNLYIDWDTLTSERQPTLATTEDGGVDRGLYVEYIGSTLTSHAFDRTTPGLGKYLITIAVWLFAISTIISWSYYGEQGVVFLTGSLSESGTKVAVLIYKLLYCGLIIVTVLPIDGWLDTNTQLDMWTTLGLGVMLVVNVPLMWLFGLEAFKAYHKYVARYTDDTPMHDEIGPDGTTPEGRAAAASSVAPVDTSYAEERGHDLPPSDQN